MSGEALEEELAAMVGKPVGSREVATAPDPVNQPMIRHWAAAFEDWNPVYTDEARASASRFGGIVAPPLMLQTWTMATPLIAGIAERGGSPVEAEDGGPLGVLDAAGYRGTLATNSEFEIVRYLRLGEVVSASDRHRRDLRGEADPPGPGPLCHVGHDLPQRGRRGGRSPDLPDPQIQDGRGAGLSDRTVPRDGASARATVDWNEVSVGDELPPMEIDVTATVIVAGAIATRDFMPVHHDRDYANTQGAPDIFMNILSDTAYCSRFLTDWAGPEARLRRLAIRLGVPMFPGSKLVYTGTVSGLSRDGAEGLVQVEFRAVNDLGEHLTGSAELGLPIELVPTAS